MTERFPHDNFLKERQEADQLLQLFAGVKEPPNYSGLQVIFEYHPRDRQIDRLVSDATDKQIFIIPEHISVTVQRESLDSLK